MEKSVRPETTDTVDATEGREQWVKPEFTTFLPVSAAAGVGYSGQPDGIINQS